MTTPADLPSRIHEELKNLRLVREPPQVDEKTKRRLKQIDDTRDDWYFD